MSWARGGYARNPFASGVGPEFGSLPGEQELPPPIPGGTSKWTYAPNPMPAYASRAWAGSVFPLPYPGGGISILPLPEQGVMRVTAWWPNASVVQLIREHADGTLWPVRGGNPLTVDQPTRYNYATNPSVEVGLHGYVPDVGNPVLARVTGPEAPRGGAYLTATIAEAGSAGVTVPTSVPFGPEVTIGLDMRISHRPETVTIQVTWTTAGGVPLPPVSAVLTADQVNTSIGQFARHVVTLTPPAGAVTPTMKVLVDGLPAGAVLGLDGFTVETHRTPGSFFDGAVYGGTWVGTAGLSESTMAPLLVLDDAECPLDVPIRYRLVNPAPTGGSMTSQSATLLSLGQTWLTHPSRPGRPVTVHVGAVPSRTREAARGIFYPVGATHPIIVSSARRRAPTGELSIGALSFAERDRLMELFADLAPVLLRAPAEYGYGAGMWLVLGDLTEDAGNRRAYQQTRILTAGFHEVEAPSELAV